VEREFTIGDRVHVIPNHICVAVNLHEQVYGVRGDMVEEVWKGGRPREAAVRRAEDQDPPSPMNFSRVILGTDEGFAECARLCNFPPIWSLM